MARNDDVELQRWVDDRLGDLTPDVEWDPSIPRGLTRLRSETGRPPRRWSLWIAVATTAAVLLLVPNPALRAFAHKCGEFIARSLPGAAGRRRRGASSLRSAMQDFTLADQDGRLITLSSLRGKVVLLTFWTTTCGAVPVGDAVGLAACQQDVSLTGRSSVVNRRLARRRWVD